MYDESLMLSIANYFFLWQIAIYEKFYACLDMAGAPVWKGSGDYNTIRVHSIVRTFNAHNTIHATSLLL